MQRNNLKTCLRSIDGATDTSEIAEQVVLSRNVFIAMGEKASETHKKWQAAERSTSNHAAFCWYDAQSLKKASELNDAHSPPRLYVQLIGEPLNCVMLALRLSSI